MKKYRKKPVIIEAVQWRGNNTRELLKALIEVSNTDSIRKITEKLDFRGIKCLEINTLEGVMKASIGDYIIKGVKGEFYPCKPDIFEQTYEEVND